MNFNKWFSLFLYYLILPFTAISYIITPLTNDTRIFLGAEGIADTFYKLPYGWDAAYEVKPIGNRIINWVMYKIANEFVPFIQNDYTHFGYLIKFTSLIILIACCYYISKKIVFPYAFPVLFLTFACEANFGIIMAEWWTALFSLVAIALCMEKDRRFMYLAGSLCFILATFKSITVLMVVPVICAVYLLGGTIDWKRFLIGYLVSGFAFLILCFTVWPYEIPDMIMSGLIAHVGMYDPITLLQWFWLTQARSNLPVVLSTYIPGLVIGIIAGLILLIYYYTHNQKFTLLLFGVLWTVPIAIIFIQSEFIVYHYLVLIIPGIISICLLMTKIKLKWQMITLAIVFILTSYIVFNSAFGSFTTFEYSFWKIKEQNADTINAQYNLTKQSSILYLDTGDGAFYFHANSSCHYITPMPVERSTATWNITYLPQFTDTYNCIMNYQGQYIVADLDSGLVPGYFGEGIVTRKSIMDLIANNYTKVADTSWQIYQKK